MKTPPESDVKQFLDGLRAGGLPVLCNKFTNTTQD